MNTRPRTDRRIRKTKESIREAFIELARENPVSEISVSELCDRADINRNTFYYHYADINALFDEITASFLESMEDVYRTDLTPVQRNTEVCRIFAANRELMGFLNRNLNSQLMRRMEALSSEYIRKALRNMHSEYSEDEYDTIAAYVIYGSFMAISRWVNDGMRMSPEEMGNLVTRIMEHGVSERSVLA